MTNNQLTDERIKELMHIGRYSHHVVCGREIADICTALCELQERRKAERDSEPVGYFGRFDPDDEDLIDQCSKNVKGAFPLYRHVQPAPVVSSEPVAYTDERNLGYIDRGRETAYLWGKQNSEPADVALYRHAQQPVVPEKATVGEMPFLGTSEGVYVRGWNDCRAAILQESQKSAGESNNCRSCENVQDLQAGNSPAQAGSRCSIKAAPDLDSSPKTAESRCGNSPVIPDGLIAAVNRLLDSDGSRDCYSAIRCHHARAEVERLLAAAPQEVK